MDITDKGVLSNHNTPEVVASATRTASPASRRKK